MAASSCRAPESSGTGGALRGRPRGLAAALSAAAGPPSPSVGWDTFAAGRPPLFTQFHRARAVAHPVLEASGASITGSKDALD